MAKILIVDDESNIRMMLRLALEHVGHTVGLAADGAEGLEKFGGGADWDLVLLDHRMPGIEGIDVLREIRARKPDARVVMITAFGTVDLASEALRLGATDFLRKPFTVELLRRVGRGRAPLRRTRALPRRRDTPTLVRACGDQRLPPALHARHRTRRRRRAR